MEASILPQIYQNIVFLIKTARKFKTATFKKSDLVTKWVKIAFPELKPSSNRSKSRPDFKSGLKNSNFQRNMP